MSVRFIGIVAVGLAAAVGFGQNVLPELRPVTGPLRSVSAKRAARIQSDGTMLGGWIELGGATASVMECSKKLCYDSFEPDLSGKPSEGYGEICTVEDPSRRWWHGADFCGMIFADDMITCPSCADETSHRVQFGFYLGACPNGQGGKDKVYIAINTADKFDCDGFDLDSDGSVDSALDDIYDGIVWELIEPLACNEFYTVSLELCQAEPSLSLQLPFDGVGGFQVTIARDYIDTNGDGTLDTLIPSECAQPLIWGNKEENPSQQTSDWWVDMNQDELFSTDECTPLTGRPCPPILGTMIAFYSSKEGLVGFEPLTGIGCNGQCNPCDANCDGSVDLLDVEPFIKLLLGTDEPCLQCAGDVNGDGSVDLSDVEAFISCLL